MIYRSILIACALGLVLAAPAWAARRGAVIATVEDMELVAETTIPDPEGGTLSLCRFTRTKSVFWFINVWQSHRFVTAPGRCEGDEYYELTPIEMRLFKGTGRLPRDLPEQPEWTPERIASGFWGIGLGGAFLLFGGLQGLRLKRAMRKRDHVLGPEDTMGKRAATVMAMAATADGRVSDPAFKLILDTLNTMTVEPLTEAELRKVIRNTPGKYTARDLEALGAGLDHEDRSDLFQAAFLSANVDGDLTKPERSFLFDLSNALGLSKDEVQLIVTRATSHQQMA